MKASIDSIETFGLVDGPGIRCVIFFNGCMLRCKYCHNPEMWKKQEENYTVDEVFQKINKCECYINQKCCNTQSEYCHKIDSMQQFCS